MNAAWRPEWLQESARRLRLARVWRGVESQYASATAQLVDSLAEHDVLEGLLEASKPAAPESGKHFLLTTPFRYRPRHDSRFRPAGGRGLWYGAHALRAACAEAAYWRRRFVADSTGLVASRLVTRHTFFAAAVDGRGIDLRRPPWDAFAEAWTRDRDYSQTQRLGVAVAEAGLELVRYASVRSPGDACIVAFTPRPLGEPRGGLDATRQEWSCVATRDHVMMQRLGAPAERFEWGRDA